MQTHGAEIEQVLFLRRQRKHAKCVKNLCLASAVFLALPQTQQPITASLCTTSEHYTPTHAHTITKCNLLTAVYMQASQFKPEQLHSVLAFRKVCKTTEHDTPFQTFMSSLHEPLLVRLRRNSLSLRYKEWASHRHAKVMLLGLT